MDDLQELLDRLTDVVDVLLPGGLRSAWARSMTESRTYEAVEQAGQEIDAVGASLASELAERHKKRHAVVYAASRVRVL